LELRIGKGGRCFLGTQASTKIYRNPRRRACGHVTQATVGENALLVFAPDPVQPFTSSSYAQRQTFQLAAGAGLVLVDWFTSGRAARGERWAFDHFQSRNEVFIAGQREFLDSILLNAASGFTASAHQTGRFNCFATLLLLGTPLKDFAEKLTQEISARPVGRRAALVASASAIPGGALLRLAGESVEEVGRELHQHLKFAAPLLGDDPWARKW
jgi:urease accessory protein